MLGAPRFVFIHSSELLKEEGFQSKKAAALKMVWEKIQGGEDMQFNATRGFDQFHRSAGT